MSEKRVPDKWIYLPLLIVSCVSFLFEIVLTRLFAIAQFYHFAFMIVSFALLGTGVSGSFFTIIPIIHEENIPPDDSPDLRWLRCFYLDRLFAVQSLAF